MKRVKKIKSEHTSVFSVAWTRLIPSSFKFLRNEEEDLINFYLGIKGEQYKASRTINLRVLRHFCGSSKERKGKLAKKSKVEENLKFLLAGNLKSGVHAICYSKQACLNYVTSVIICRLVHSNLTLTKVKGSYSYEEHIVSWQHWSLNCWRGSSSQVLKVQMGIKLRSP